MVKPRPGGPPPPFRQPNVETSRAPVNVESWLGWAAAILVVLGIAGMSRCSGTNSAGNSAAFVDGNVSNGISAQAPPPLQPLSAAAASRGMAHLRLAVGAEGFSGAMIYSQNCYDALAHQFSWAKLDTCGAFDMLAARSIADLDMSGMATEAGYFQSEAAAGRYLGAATAAGEPAGEADTRLSELQARVRPVALVGQRAPVPPEDAQNQVEASQEAASVPGATLAQCVRGALGRLPPNADRTTLCTCALEKISRGGRPRQDAIDQCAIEVEAEFADD